MPRIAKSMPATVSAPQQASTTNHLFIGTSGWAYPTWKPGFYPSRTPARSYLSFYASQLTAVEVNYTFRTLPTTAQLQSWLSAAPAGFRFSFKAPQRITHFQRLKASPELDASLTAFLESVAPAATAGQLGQLLFQLPPNFAADSHDNQSRLEAFLGSTVFAAYPHFRLAFEFRHPSWFAELTYTLLRRHNVALCVAEGDDLVTPDVSTADFNCYRLRRDGGYSSAELSAFAERFAALSRTSEVFVFLRHQEEPIGALNARFLLEQARVLAGGRT